LLSQTAATIKDSRKDNLAHPFDRAMARTAGAGTQDREKKEKNGFPEKKPRKQVENLRNWEGEHAQKGMVSGREKGRKRVRIKISKIGSKRPQGGGGEGGGGGGGRGGGGG